jgi:hypothetical protein
VAKVAQLRDDLAAVRKRLDAADAAEAAARRRGGASPEIEAAADRLIRGEPIDTESPAPINRARLEREVAIYEVAVRKQEQVVEAEGRKAAATVRERLLPHHKALAGRMRRALMDLRDAVKEEGELVEALLRHSIGFGAPLQSVASPLYGDSAGHRTAGLDNLIEGLNRAYPHE